MAEIKDWQEVPIDDWQEVKPETETKTGYSAKEVPAAALSNLPESAIKTGKSFVDPQTYQGLGEVSRAVTPGGWLSLFVEGKNPLDVIKNAGYGLYKTAVDRYGSWENIKRTVAEDPVGFGFDLSSVLSAGGTAIPKLGAIGTALEPVNVIKRMTAVPLKVIPSERVRRLYESAIKPTISQKMPIERRNEMVKVGLDEGILPNDKGLGKLQGRIDSINGEIRQVIDQSVRPGNVVDANAVVSRIDELKNFYSKAPNPQPFLDDLDNLAQVFVDFHGQRLTPQLAQEIKQTTYAINRKHYGELKSVQVEGQKAIARGIKEELASQYPELNTLNKTEGAMLDLEREIERAVKRIHNRDVVGIGSTIAGTFGGIATQSTTGGWLVGITKSVIDNPIIKSRVAIALNNAKAKSLISKKATTARQTIVEMDRIEKDKAQLP